MKRRLPLDALQIGVYNILSTKQTVPVYDSVANGAEFPYIVFSDYEYDIGGSKDTDMSEVTLEIEIWSDYAGKGCINGIAEDIVNALTTYEIDLSADGFRVLIQSVRGGKGVRSGTEFYGVVYFTAKIQNVGV